ncbi:MAG: PH domain-containing protein [Alphaproteobacteria bacterium]|nr:PH domain-containing protein [Alphaproteobacteria bacterium]
MAECFRTMSYVEHVIQPGETLVYRAPLHWIVYVPGVALAAIGAVILGYGLGMPTVDANGWQNVLRVTILAAGALVLLAALISLTVAFIRRHTTEIAVTSRRAIYKTGVVRRITSEISVDKIETVLVDQSVLGRILNFGTIVIRGTGGGLEPVRNIGDPLTFRSKLTARP